MTKHIKAKSKQRTTDMSDNNFHSTFKVNKQTNCSLKNHLGYSCKGDIKYSECCKRCSCLKVNKCEICGEIATSASRDIEEIEPENGFRCFKPADDVHYRCKRHYRISRKIYL